VEFFNLVLELQLTQSEKADIVAFLRALQQVRTNADRK
jgi:hypothetical protein